MTHQTVAAAVLGSWRVGLVAMDCVFVCCFWHPMFQSFLGIYLQCFITCRYELILLPIADKFFNKPLNKNTDKNLDQNVNKSLHINTEKVDSKRFDNKTIDKNCVKIFDTIIGFDCMRLCTVTYFVDSELQISNLYHSANKNVNRNLDHEKNGLSY